MVLDRHDESHSDAKNLEAKLISSKGQKSQVLLIFFIFNPNFYRITIKIMHILYTHSLLWSISFHNIQQFLEIQGKVILFFYNNCFLESRIRNFLHSISLHIYSHWPFFNYKHHHLHRGQLDLMILKKNNWDFEYPIPNFFQFTFLKIFFYYF